MPRVSLAAADRLVDAAVGTTVRVSSLDTDEPAQRRRLAEFGLRPGASATVLARTSGGGRLLGLGASRIAVDAGTAARVGVRW